MKCFDTLPIEIVEKIIENVEERPFKTELLLLHKTLYSFFMVEQIKSLKLKDKQLDRWISVIEDNYTKKPHPTLLQYRNLQSKIHKLDIIIHENISVQAMAEFINNCTNLCSLSLELPPQDASLIFDKLPSNVNEIAIKGIYSKNMNNEIQSLIEYMRRGTKFAKKKSDANISKKRTYTFVEDPLPESKETYLKIHFHKCKRYKGDDGSISFLADGLKHNIMLTVLNLQNNSISAQGAFALAGCLKENVALTNLNLKDNSINSEGAHSLAESLKQNTTLRSLSLLYNNIGAEGACSLAECLKQNRSLTDLELVDNEIGDRGARALAESLKQNKTLTNLNLGVNAICDEGAIALAKCLRQNTTLNILSLNSNKISDEGARALAECLKQSTALTNLNLEDNEIHSEGARALVEGLKQNMTLTSLNLHHNKIDSSTLADLKANSVITL